MKKWTKVLLVLACIAALTTVAFAVDDSTSCPHCHETADWVLWDGSAITQSGHYYLSKNVTLAAQVELSALDVVVDLGGSTLDASQIERAFSVLEGAQLTIIDTSIEQNGTIIGGTTVASGGGAIRVEKATLNIYGGTITGGTTSSYAPEGGTDTSYAGGNILAVGATVNIYGGTISDGKSGLGGNIATATSASTVNIYGGTITGGESSFVDSNLMNKALRGGGNIYISGHSVFNIYGGTISDGSARRAGGNISVWMGTLNMYGGTVSGGTSLTTDGYTTSVRASGLLVYRGTNYGSFYMYGGLLDSTLTYYGDATDMIIYNGKLKSNPTDVVNSRGSSTNRAYALAECSCYTTDGTYYTVWHTGNNNGSCSCGINYNEKAQPIYTGAHEYENDKCKNCGDAYVAAPEDPDGEPNQPGAGTCSVCNKDVTWTAWDGKTRPAEGDHFRLTASATMTDVFTVAEGEDICVDLNGYTLTAANGKRAFYVQGKLDIMDSRNAGTVKGSNHANNGGTIYVTSSGALTLNSGTISGGTADGKYGGNIYAAGPVEIKGGTVSGGNADRGGNIYATKTLNILGGAISGGSVGTRGGNIASTSVLNIYDGAVISSGSANYGGNIYSTNKVNMYGGTITGGSAANGANISLIYADLLVEGGEITDPVDNYNIHANGTETSGNATIVIRGGTLSGGTVYMLNVSSSDQGKVTITGGTVNSSVLLQYGAAFEMTGGYLAKLNDNCNILAITGGKLGFEPYNLLSSCACATKNTDGTYSVWHYDLKGTTCSVCGGAYTNATTGSHTYEATAEQGTAACKYCSTQISDMAAVCNGVAYETLGEALAAATSGNKVVMLANVTMTTVTVPAGVFLDLYGYTLTADSVTAAFDGTRIMDSKGNGLLAVLPENVTMVHAGNKLPVKTENGIQLAEVTYKRELSEVNENQYKFRFHFTQEAKSLLAQAMTEAGGTDVKLIIKVFYKNAAGEDCVKTVEVSKELIDKYTSAWGKKQFVVTITGTKNITNLSCVVSVESIGVGVNSDTCATGKGALENKKVIFFGNSHTYYGKCVLDKSGLTQDDRDSDKGQFYQICASNGINLDVTNFTFGNHEFSDIYSGCCGADRSHNGLDHLSEINMQDYYYDYVIMQQGSGGNVEDILSPMLRLLPKFYEANPDVKVIFLVHLRAVENDYKWLQNLNELREMGIQIVDWGSMIYDVFTGAVQVPGATLEYNRNSFVIAQSASDGYHANLLTGYITAMTVYCAITGESAVGQAISYGEKDSILSASAIASFKAKYYKPDSGNTYDYSTNFDQILSSEADMRGIQMLIDRYLKNNP